jgi:ATP-dependent DNA helicase RecQ
MEFYAESPVCRRRQLLHYFGEEFKQDNCGMCDNCVHPRERFDGHRFKFDKILDAYETFADAASTKALKVIIEA